MQSLLAREAAAGRSGRPDLAQDSQGARRQVPAIIDNILRAGEGKTLRKLKTLASQINSIEEDFKALSDAELRATTDELKQRYADGETLDDLLPEAFATAREAASRVLGQRPRPRRAASRPPHLGQSGPQARFRPGSRLRWR